MWAMCDISAEAYQAPYRDDGPFSSALYGLFCMICVSVLQLFMVQLFITVLICEFSKAEGSSMLTEKQETLRDILKLVEMLKPVPKALPPETTLADFCYKFSLDVRPAAVPLLEESLESGRVPDVRHATDLKMLGEAIQVRQQELEGEQDKGQVRALQNALQVLNSAYTPLRTDGDLFEVFETKKLERQPLPPGWLYLCGSWFDTVCFIFICTNILFMCTKHQGQSQEWEDFLWWQALAFNTLFTFEMAIKNCSLGFRFYWSSGFDCFDGVVVLLSWLFLGFELAGLGVSAIVCVLRVGRIFRVVKRVHTLQAVLTSTLSTLPIIASVFFLLAIMFSVFAVIGVQLFGEVRSGESLNMLANFKTFPTVGRQDN